MVSKNKCKGCQPTILVSACLMGVPCRYDGLVKKYPQIDKLVKSKKAVFVPVCPEQLGGLPTPRPGCQIVGKRVLTESGQDCTEEFGRGAKVCVRIAKMLGAKTAILKTRSPSCGVGQVKDGTFTGNLKRGSGITAKALRRAGLNLLTEEDIAAGNYETDFFE